mmetsp:Transcript_8384/g.5981  ORF Transcript_8384/g.5981 Transcript_8384/m.5981 type:complete len:102 (-) Transcript_8384:2040-2345(-)
MLEAIRIRSAGYAIRVTQEDFFKRYRLIIDKPERAKAAQDIRMGTDMILKKVTSDKKNHKLMDPKFKNWQIGISKVFMKEEVRQLMETCMSFAVLDQAKDI